MVAPSVVKVSTISKCYEDRAAILLSGAGACLWYSCEPIPSWVKTLSCRSFSRAVKGITLALALCASRAEAFEIYRFVGADCKQSTGVIVDVDDAKIHLLSVEGQYRSVTRADISYVLVYNTVTNPIGSITLGTELKVLLRDVYIGTIEKPTLTGWPIQFIEDLVVFFDIEGKQNLIDQDKLLAIRAPEGKLAPVVKVANSKPQAFSFGTNLPQCPEKVDAGAVQPTRMLSDKIRITEFLGRYDVGFTKLKRFQNRTRFYARPYLFEQKSRISFTFTEERFTEELPVSMLPLAFQWASGKAFSHQGGSTVGFKPIRLLPNVEPVFGASTDLKIHFFNASLAGNLFSLPAGKTFMTANKAFFADHFQKLAEDDVRVYTHFNYLALSGIDYGPYSVAAGVFYPIFGIYADGYFRELLASQSSLMMKLQYMNAKSTWRLIYSGISRSKDSPTEEDALVSLSTEMRGGAAPPARSAIQDQLGSFDLKANFVRFGVEHEWSKELKGGLDEVLLIGTYEEDLAGSTNEIKFNQYTTAFFIQQQFGNYVALQLDLNLFLRRFDVTTDGDKDTQESRKPSGSMTLEFML